MKTPKEQIDFLLKAKEQTALLNELTQRAQEKELEFKKASKELLAEQKAVEDSIDITIKRRKSELTKTFDSEIEKSDHLLRRAKSQRAQEKEKGQNKRIARETAEIAEGVRRYNAMMRTAFKKDNAPGICNTRLFYSLTTPLSIGDIFIDIILFALAFIGVPFLLFMIFDFSGLTMVFVGAATAFVFGFIYIKCFLQVKMNHYDAVMYGKKIRRKISADKKQISAIKHSIKEDKNEEMYNLGGFDEQIADISDDKDRVAKGKQAALDDFERNIKPDIINEIQQTSQNRIDELTYIRNNAKQEMDELADKAQKLNLVVASEYQTVLGKKYDDEMIDYLIAYLESGQATTITEAQKLYSVGTKIYET